MYLGYIKCYVDGKLSLNIDLFFVKQLNKGFYNSVRSLFCYNC